MSQTTDQARGKSAASVPGRKVRSTRTPKGSAVRPTLPSPPRRRRPALTALAVLLIVGGAALAGLLAVRMDSREPVLVISQQVSGGQKISLDVLESRNVSGDGLNAIPASQAKEFTKFYARQTIYKGQLLTPDLLRREPPLTSDQAQVGIPLTSGKYPPGLRSGDAIRLVQIGDAQNASVPLSTGLVIGVGKAKSSSFGGDARSAVATVIVPQSVVDQVVGATGTDSLGIALIGRGLSIGEAEITDLSSGRR